jgi:hypothetical protein
MINRSIVADLGSAGHQHRQQRKHPEEDITHQDTDRISCQAVQMQRTARS